MRDPSACTASTLHDFAERPSISTVQAPQLDVSQPTTVPVLAATSRRKCTRSRWLRTFLVNHAGGLVVISHDVSLLEATVNRVFHLDANRQVLDVYNVGWTPYLEARETDERRPGEPKECETPLSHGRW